ncbi:hypothetical protein ILYODFUR_028856 [Ilyodon furcidens]|uniref:Uncharacterized protein n=1 Tax=Ilyodon furcidens TaxID=33524 RepID=A0ABV0TD92_9TELE
MLGHHLNRKLSMRRQVLQNRLKTKKFDSDSWFQSSSRVTGSLSEPRLVGRRKQAASQAPSISYRSDTANGTSSSFRTEDSVWMWTMPEPGRPLTLPPAGLKRVLLN